MNQHYKLFGACLAGLMMAGCANMVNGTQQSLYIDAGDHADCQITRDDGLNLSVRSMQTFSVKRSASALKVHARTVRMLLRLNRIAASPTDSCCST